MNVIFVIGLAGSGKSTYISNMFPNAAVVDLFDFQENISSFADVVESYTNCQNALIQVCRNAKEKGNDVVLEHTLLRRCRRKSFIDAVRLATDAPIHLVAILPEAGEIAERRKKRGLSPVMYNLDQIKQELEVFEFPEINEGYETITVER